MTNKLWIAAIIVRAVAITIAAARRAPLPWTAWAVYAEVTDLILLYCFYAGLFGVNGWYMRFSSAQQIGTTLLLIWVVCRMIDPPESLVIASSIISAAVGVAICLTRIWPNSMVEPVLIFCGLATLAMGLQSVVIAVATFRPDRYILAVYLMLLAFLMLAAPAYLQSVGLGRAWEVLEICAFTAWGGYYLRKAGIGPDIPSRA